MGMTAVGQTQDPSLPLAKIDFAGLKNVKRAPKIAASGLQLGQRINKSDLDKAAKELSASGLFLKVQYKYRQYDDRFEVTFTVEESISNLNMPVTFDNFVWFTDKELADAVRKEMPAFNGTAPDGEGAINSIKRALAKLLQERKLPGEIDYTSFSDDVIRSKSTEHVFSVKGVSLPICSIHYQSAEAVAESTLIDNSKALIKRDYSIKDVSQYVEGLTPLYGKIGHLRAVFEIPTAKLKETTDSGCPGGVDVYVKVDEGLAYNWDKADWSGNQALPIATLQKAMQMNAGEVADSTKIAAGYTRIGRAYGRIGHIAARISPRATFDDQNRTVSYAITINEGPQYHMGKVTVTGVSAADAKPLIEAWSLQEGAVYDDTYMDDYRNKLRGISIGPNANGKKMNLSQKVDWQNHLVNLLIEFK
jgi:outer membrane protein assembly factor BamA